MVISNEFNSTKIIQSVRLNILFTLTDRQLKITLQKVAAYVITLHDLCLYSSSLSSIRHQHSSTIIPESHLL